MWGLPYGSTYSNPEMDRQAVPKPYLPLRMIDYGQFSYYYAYGNRPAEDLLEYVHPEDEKAPTILSLGCGDPRSFFYTLWKHFTPSLSERHFFGARFILNDISAAVLARNILFLYLAVKIPPWTQREAAKQWISSMWAIWYCHELLPIHEETLKEALATLLKLSDTMKSWEGSQHAISQIVSFTDDGTRAAVRRMWDMWNEKSFKLPHETFLLHVSPVCELNQVSTMQNWFQAIGLSTYATEDVKDAIDSEFGSSECHNMYAEKCLNIPHSTGCKVVNPTLFERENGLYTLHPGSSPFVCFHHGFIFSKSQIQEVTGSGFPEVTLIVEDDAFIKHPLLSNSVQQFSMWVSSSAAMLIGQISQQKRDITLTLNCSDCLVFCEELQRKGYQNVPTLSFDTIFTSNLIDYLPPPLLVLVVKPLLKIKSFLLTTSFHYRRIFASAEKYLSEIFGFSPNLLPLLFGIRCVGHDGEYGDSTSIIPIPIQIRNLLTTPDILSGLVCRTDKFLFWQVVNSQPTIVKSLNGCALSTLLHKIFFEQLRHFYKDNNYAPTVMCSETAINTILSFASQLDSDVDISNYMFWNDICALIKSNTHLCPFLVHIQTQALLHGLHFHIILTSADCPICLKKPLEEHISQFSIEFDPLSMEELCSDQGVTPAFVILIHKALVDPKLLIDHDKLRSGEHIVDSAQGFMLACGKVRLNFFFPTRFAEESYFYTVIRYVMINVDETNLYATAVATLSGELCQRKIPFLSNSFYFKQAGAGRAKSISSSLGTILSHVGDGDHMETVLSLSSKPLALLSAKTASLKFEYLSPSTIRVVCDKYNLTLTLPYPVDYSRIKAQVSRSYGLFWINFPRKNNHFYDEKHAITNPSCSMMLPTAELPANDIARILDMQFLKKEEMLLKEIPNFSEFKTKFPTFPASVRVKVLVSWLFQPVHNFVIYAPPTCIDKDEVDPFAYLLIHRRAVDVQRCTPVVEIFYLDYSDVPLKRLEGKLYTLLTQDVETSDTTRIDEKTWSELKQVLIYFAHCTLPTSRNLPHLLCKRGLEEHFTRAIVYSLYFDQDVVYESVDSLVSHLDLLKRMSTDFARPPLTPHSVASSTTEALSLLNGGAMEAARVPIQNDEGCSYCGEKFDKLKKCTRCGETWYCNKQCQAGHWKEHKKICKPPAKKATKSEELSSKCSNCGKKTESLKRCGTCQVAAYCSKECQRNDWTRHKSECTKK